MFCFFFPFQTGQVLHDYFEVPYVDLFFISWGFVCLGALACFFLPRPRAVVKAVVKAPSLEEGALSDSGGDKLGVPLVRAVANIGDSDTDDANPVREAPGNQAVSSWKSWKSARASAAKIATESFRRGAYEKHVIGYLFALPCDACIARTARSSFLVDSWQVVRVVLVFVRHEPDCEQLLVRCRGRCDVQRVYGVWLRGGLQPGEHAREAHLILVSAVLCCVSCVSDASMR